MSLAREILRQKKQELLAQVAELRKDIRELDAALELLGDVAGKAGSTVSPAGSVPSPINAAILEAISQGNSTPEAIYLFVVHQMQVDTTKNSISTRLSKLKNDGLIENDGQGWTLVEKAKGSDAQTSEPFDELGPATGRERGYPPSAPEGSIPSGSTVARDLKAGLANVQGTMPSRLRDLDDEIPF
ncbi:MAG: hypothetical protein E5X72_09655 [Mesorhizobium sp.]|uniref:hypothetical protein n=1 Tax=Mesorhizobium sp. TaxID=1871066 RepID=UPI0012184B42|nr:hypothetical protein [Mesorhizobium sp.]TIP04935.1 MAG: hypothetical protein E5X72_09655 [Mesorhizobium sp.]